MTVFYSRAEPPASTSRSAVRQALLGLCLALLCMAAACREVDHCEKGVLRCLGGPCDNRDCDFDLVCGQRSTGEELCGKKSKGGRFDFGDGKEDAKEVERIDPNCS